jgi:hypothetical protein
MKYIKSHEDNIRKQSEETLFNLRGESTDGVSEKVYSKSLNIDLGNNQAQNRYFIRIFNSTPFDPFGPEARREIWNRTELRQVSKNTFEAYNQYLATRNRIFWTKTNRSYIDG